MQTRWMQCVACFWLGVLSEDLREKGVEVNFRRALLQQCQAQSRVIALSGFLGAF